VLFEGAVQGGARALGLGPVTGIAQDAAADFVSLNLEAPALGTRDGDALLDSLIFAGSTGCIDGVWRAGRKVVSDGRHLERGEIARVYQATLRRLLRQD
jgi:cytosine/adenosine deaminase-related metal-dependent hydrolase